MTLETKMEKGKTGFTVKVLEGDNLLGKYTIDNRKGLATGRLDSFQSGRGIPRLLIKTASEQLQHLVDDSGNPIKHEVTASFGRSKKVLPRLFLEQGYHPDDHLNSTTSTGYSKTYSPKNKNSNQNL